MIRLIASDIDGTLLQSGATEIPPEIFAHIHRLEKEGILFCPASGRQYTSLRRLFAPVADKVPFLCENGAVVYGPGSPGPILSKTVMDRRLAEELCGEILALPETEVLISGADVSYLCPKTPDLEDQIRWFLGNRTAVLPAPADVPEDVVKVSAYCPKGVEAAKAALFPKWERHFRCAVAGEVWLDFTLADKGLGVRRLCGALGVSMEEVMAFGDNYNDVSMLEQVGRPYLMETAAPELRARFSTRCRTVAEVLETL
ncbi:HAD family hydrolase [Oscillibacter sp.]|uniref:HAD family hydrolase n=1 Tax=Oscillibacter sp. TaxID=1945593 RepID=UPI002D806273|nr:HAD family hydrolase [Oscillibacter sp.]